MISSDAMNSRGYNGWPNHETWLVALWLDNEERSFRQWRETARSLLLEARTDDRVLKDGMSIEDAAVCLLADDLSASVEAYMPDWGNTMYADLLRCALAEVEWRAIASHILEDAV
jgi:hypothetical protein